MKVSVIIPVYKGNNYINGLVSMMNSNYEFMKQANYEMEVIFVNDYVDIPIIVDENAIKFPHKILNNEKNLGIHKSRVNGLEQSSADYVLFLDQDDVIKSDTVLSQISKIGEGDFIVSNGFYENDNKEKIQIYDTEKHQYCCLNIDFHYGYDNPIISPGQVLIKRDAIPEEWKKYTFKNNGADDHYLWLLMLEKEKKGKINTRNLFLHVNTGNNTSHDYEMMYRSNLELAEQLIGIASKKHIRELKRRAMYYSSPSHGFLHKMCYADVGIMKRKFAKCKK